MSLQRINGFAVISSTNFDLFAKECEKVAATGFEPMGPAQTMLTADGAILYTITFVRREEK